MAQALSGPRRRGGAGRLPPGPPLTWLLAHSRAFGRDPLHYLRLLTRQYGDVVYLRLPLRPTILVNSPAGVQRILQTHNRNYNKQSPDFALLRSSLGRGLLTNEGADWLAQRRLIGPALHQRRVAALGALMVAATQDRLAGRWAAAAADGQPLDVAAEMQRLTLDIVTAALFGQSLTAQESATVLTGTLQTQRQVNDLFYVPFPPLWLPTRGHRAYWAAVQAVDRVVETIIARGRAQPGAGGELLALLLAAPAAPAGPGQTARPLRDEIVTLLIAGHESTANTLSWAWYLLARWPAVGARLRAELAAVLGGRAPTAADLPQLPYTRMVIEETMRLYPSAWILSRRRALAADEIDGYHVPAGTLLLVSPYALHQHPRWWPQPEVFDPERFAPDRRGARPAFAYFPFGGGPHLCVGMHFALLNALLVLATVAQHYRLDLVPGQPAVPEPLVTLRVRDGLRMTLHTL